MFVDIFIRYLCDNWSLFYMMMIAFITIKISLMSLIEGLRAQI